MLRLTTALGALVIALDRGQGDGTTAAAGTGWLAAGGVAGLVCVAILVAGLWAMPQK